MSQNANRKAETISNATNCNEVEENSQEKPETNPAFTQKSAIDLEGPEQEEKDTTWEEVGSSNESVETSKNDSTSQTKDASAFPPENSTIKSPQIPTVSAKVRANESELHKVHAVTPKLANRKNEPPKLPFIHTTPRAQSISNEAVVNQPPPLPLTSPKHTLTFRERQEKVIHDIENRFNLCVEAKKIEVHPQSGKISHSSANYPVLHREIEVHSQSLPIDFLTPNPTWNSTFVQPESQLRPESSIQSEVSQCDAYSEPLREKNTKSRNVLKRLGIAFSRSN